MTAQSPASTPENPREWMTRVTWMSVIAATGVGIVYVPQPIQPLFAQEFGIDQGWASAASVSVQAGYALGIIFLVALGDRFAPRVQVTTQLALTSLALIVTALAPHYLFIVVSVFVAGASATVGQILVSSALRLSPPEKRARTASTIVGAIVIGLFTVRTLLGSLADLVGWRIAVLIVALIVLALLPVSWKYSPPSAPANPPKYRTILASMPAIARRSPTLRRMAIIHLLVFAGFIAIWSMSALHAVNDLGITVTEASLLGVAGILGGVTTMVWVGRQTRVSQRALLALTLVAAALSSRVVIFAPDELWLLIPALFLVSFAMSSEQVVTQARALSSVSGEESGRANTVYMASTFVGSSLATAVAAWLYTQVGYFAIGIFALACVLAATAVAVGANRQKMFAA